ncbi:MAG: PAS domain S-box protein [Promethearchaeota archaeon]
MQVSKEKEGEEDISENRYEFLINNIQDVIVELDLDKTITYINPKVYNAFGYKQEEVIGKKIFDFIHEDDKPKLEENIMEAIKKRHEIAMEFRIQHKDGHFVPIAMRGSMAKSKGKLIPMAVLSDITDRKKSEKKLSDLAEKYNNIIKYTSDIIAEVDMKGVFTYISPQVHDLTGMEQGSFIGKRWYDFAVSDVEEIKKQLHPSNDVDEIKFEFKGVNQKSLSGIWLEVKGKRFTDVHGNKKDLIIVRDVTEKKTAEENIKKALEKQSFYRRLFTHDINNILHIMQTSISLLSIFQKDPNRKEDTEDLIKLMKEQIVRGSLLVTNVRRLSELESTDFPTQPIDVCDLLRSAIKFVREGFQNIHFEINVNFEGELFFVEANELLSNVFENILINAAKYNDSAITEIKINISSYIIEDVEYIKIEFIDNGIGIEDDRKEVIFKEGHEKDKGGKGMGFGLSLVKKIIESYHGKIWVEDRIKGDYKKGSNFTILIPKRDYFKFK